MFYLSELPRTPLVLYAFMFSDITLGLVLLKLMASNGAEYIEPGGLGTGLSASVMCVLR